MTTPPTAASVAPTYTSVGQTSVTLNNVPALSPAGTGMPSNITVAGSSDSAANGSYAQTGTQNGAPLYELGGSAENTIYWSGSGWILQNSDDALFSNFSGSATSFPTTGWNAIGPASVPTFTLSVPSAATSLAVWRSLSSMMSSPVEIGLTPSTNYTDTGLSPGTTYYYMYVETNSAGSAEGPISSVTTLHARRRSGVVVF